MKIVKIFVGTLCFFGKSSFCVRLSCFKNKYSTVVARLTSPDNIHLQSKYTYMPQSLDKSTI